MENIEITSSKLIFGKEMIITTAQMCMKKLRILVMHLVKHIELVRKYLTFDTRKPKKNMAKKAAR